MDDDRSKSIRKVPWINQIYIGQKLTGVALDSRVLDIPVTGRSMGWKLVVLVSYGFVAGFCIDTLCHLRSLLLYHIV